MKQGWNSVCWKTAIQRPSELLVWYLKKYPAFSLFKITKTILIILYGPYGWQNFQFWFENFKSNMIVDQFFPKIGSIRRNTQSICLLTQPSESPATNETKFIKLSIIIIFIVCFINFLVSWIKNIFRFRLIYLGNINRGGVCGVRGFGCCKYLSLKRFDESQGKPVQYTTLH